ncbi:MAG TPA: MFS transporter [Gaiellaceae bacterium]|nr:MFS transporter [Gaiellaceae bacterium]
MRKPTGALWSHRDFLKLWTGQTISEFGSQVSQLAIPAVAVLTLKATPFQVAALETVVFLPFLILTLPAGVWVDRWRRRWILIGGDFGRAVLLATIPLAYALGDLTLTQLYIVGFLVGIHTVFFDVAYQSYLPQLVDRETLVEGNSKLQMTVSGAAIVGPGLSGGLIAIAGAPYAILVDACSFVVSGGFTAAIRKREDPPPTTGRRRLLVELWEGLRYVTHHRLLFPQALATGSSNFATNIIFSVYFVFAYRHLHLTPGLMGVIGAIAATGWLIGSATADWFRRRLGVNGATILGMAVGAPASLLIPFAPVGHAAIPFLCLAGMLGGFGAVVYNIQQVSLRQAITPERLQGRMNASMRFFVWGTIPLGSLVGGALATAFGVQTAILVGACLGFLSLLPILLSPLRTLREFPAQEEVPLLHEAGLLGGPAAVDV